MRRPQKLYPQVAYEQHGVQISGTVVVVERLEPGRESAIGQAEPT